MAATRAKIDYIFASPLVRLNLHLPDNDNQMKLDVNESYLDLLEYAIEKMRPDQAKIHFIGEPHSKIDNFFKNSKFFREKYRQGLELEKISNT